MFWLKSLGYIFATNEEFSQTWDHVIVEVNEAIDYRMSCL